MNPQERLKQIKAEKLKIRARRKADLQKYYDAGDEIRALQAEEAKINETLGEYKEKAKAEKAEQKAREQLYKLGFTPEQADQAIALKNKKPAKVEKKKQ